MTINTSTRHPVNAAVSPGVDWKNAWRKFQVTPGVPIRLDRYDPDDTGGIPHERGKISRRLGKLLKKIDKLQEQLYAEQKQSLLIVLQGMDTSGKDGVIRNVIRGMSPQGVSVTSFKRPTPEELSHDFLWRIEKRLPGMGQVGVFNRSHYEDVVAARERKLVAPSVWKARYEKIRAFESRISRPDPPSPPTKVIKIFLHISMDEQWKRLNQRLGEKPWKLEDADFLDLTSWKKYAAKWNGYQRAWEDAINETASADSPWFVVPSNDKEVRDLLVAEIVYRTFKSMNIAEPPPKVDVEELKRKVGRMNDQAARMRLCRDATDGVSRGLKKRRETADVER